MDIRFETGITFQSQKRYLVSVMADTDNDKAGEVSENLALHDTEAAGPAVDEKSLLRKIDAHLLPAVGCVVTETFPKPTSWGV